MTRADIRIIAVLGAGTMGQGIAQVYASAGFKTLLYDVRADAVDDGIEKIKNSLAIAVSKNKMSALRAEEILNRIVPTRFIGDVIADLIIEAVVEDLLVKQELFSDIEKINKGAAILATNTSSLSVTAISAVLQKQGNFIGIHFFNPAPLMQLVEVVSGEKTDPFIVAVARELLYEIGKTVVTSADSPGFIVNRVARHFYLESLRAVEEEVCDMRGADALLRSAGFKMGPFELMDLIGIDINYAVSKSVYEAFNKTERFKPSSLQEQKVSEGKLGRKSGEGFYTY